MRVARAWAGNRYGIGERGYRGFLVNMIIDHRLVQQLKMDAAASIEPADISLGDDSVSCGCKRQWLGLSGAAHNSGGVRQWNIIERKWNAIFMPAGKHCNF